jgi:hypothetical protein
MAMALPAMRRRAREVEIAGAAGLGVGAVAAGVAYACWLQARGPTLAGVAAILVSVVVVVGARFDLARRRRVRASDWLALGYTAAIVVAVALLAIDEALRGIFDELNGAAVW